jgi:endoglucanase
VWPTFHYYEPFDFTHQGASWVSPSPPLGRMYGTPADAARLVKDADKIRAYVARTGKVPLMGESGAFETISTPQRVAYTAPCNTFVPMGVAVCQWAYTNTFPFYDHVAGRWVPGMLGAIGLPEQK